MSTRLLLAATILLFGCNTQQDTFQTKTPAEAGVASNSIPINSELFALSVKPQLMIRDTRARITLDVEKEISGKLLLIDARGNILHSFHEGQFEEKRYSFAYSAPEDLPFGQYIVLLADEENIVIDYREITFTDRVMDKLN
jgi:uncharacterized lipoprotein YajG